VARKKNETSQFQSMRGLDQETVERGSSAGWRFCKRGAHPAASRGTPKKKPSQIGGGGEESTRHTPTRLDGWGTEKKPSSTKKKLF